MREQLTERQRDVLNYLVEHIQVTGLPPTVREIGEQMGLSSTNGVFKHLKELERKGFISHNPDKARSIHVVGYQEILRLHQRMRRIPVFGRVAAGKPIEAQVSECDRFLDVDESIFGAEASFALEVRGDSMVEAGIHDGDIVVIRPQSTARNGDVVVALIGDEATVKRFEQRGDELLLVPANSAMQPMVFPAGSAGFSIEGKVVGLVRKYR